MNIRVGCGGFAGAQASCFRDFRLVEVQQTFYEPPRVTTTERWRASAPADFEFTVKAWQLITHEATSPTYRRLRTPLAESAAANVGSFKPTAEVWNAWERTREMAAALGARVVVFQCPALFAATRELKENLRRFFMRVRAEFRDRREACPTLAWEPRGDWSDAEVRELCRELELVHVVDPFVRMPVTREPFYFRLHGIGGYGHRYSGAELRQLLNVTQRFESGGYCLLRRRALTIDLTGNAIMGALLSNSFQRTAQTRVTIQHRWAVAELHHSTMCPCARTPFDSPACRPPDLKAQVGRDGASTLRSNATEDGLRRQPRRSVAEAHWPHLAVPHHLFRPLDAGADSAAETVSKVSKPCVRRDELHESLTFSAIFG